MAALAKARLELSGRQATAIRGAEKRQGERESEQRRNTAQKLPLISSFFLFACRGGFVSTTIFSEEPLQRTNKRGKRKKRGKKKKPEQKKSVLLFGPPTCRINPTCSARQKERLKK
jgi:hypothetical protein